MANESSNFFRDNDDLVFQFKHGVKWDELVALAENGFTLPDGPKNVEEAVAFYEQVIESVGEYAAREIAPRAAVLDRKGTHLENGEVVFPPELTQIFDGMREMGLFGLMAPRELGGTNCPGAVGFLINEVLARADVSVLTHYGFHTAIISSLIAYSIREGSTRIEKGVIQSTRWEKAIREIVDGKAFGCMVLTEPGAGSDLGALRARAVERDGKWYLTGEKIFITSGHGQYQLVLAKTEEEKSKGGMRGLDALSLFLVPRKIERDGKRIDNVKITKVEEKLGHHASATCALLYEESECELVGKRGEGFPLMLFLMNMARIAVGVEGVGLCEAAYRAARAYASERWAFGKPIEQHELVAEKLLDMDTWIRGLRAMAVECINAAEAASKLELRLLAEPPSNLDELAAMKARQQKLSKRARRLTPLFKAMASELAVCMARDAMQIHGGMGYIDETGVHKLLRDALVMPVYEGTTQIQALMATKDHLLAAARNPASFLRRGARARLLARTAGTPLARDVHKADATVYRTTETLMLRIFGQKVKSEWEGAMKGKDPKAWGKYLARRFLRQWDVKADFSQGLLHAERLMRMLADVAIGKILVKQAERFPERKKYAERFVHKMLLRVEAAAREIEHDDGSVFEAILERQALARSA